MTRGGAAQGLPHQACSAAIRSHSSNLRRSVHLLERIGRILGYGPGCGAGADALVLGHGAADGLACEVVSDQCLFCGIVAGDIPSIKVAEDDATYAFMDINPASDGHLLVVPKRHSRDLFEITPDDLTAVTLSAQRIARAAVTELGADGVNLLNACGAEAWQTVFHFHLHVVPRYADQSRDRLAMPWQPGVPGDMDAIAAVSSRLGAVLEQDHSA